MNVIMRAVDSLRPYGRNTKKHDETQIANVAKSIDKFGWRQPIVIDRDGVIVIGHCRWLAAKKLGLKEVPVTVADDLTEDKIRELRIIDNKTNESPWEYELLAEELEGLDLEGYELDFGLADGGQEPHAEDDNYTAEPGAEPHSVRGDVYICGRHRVMCGDATSESDIATLTDGARIGTYIVDPPYEQEELYGVIPRNDGGRLFVMTDHKHWQAATMAATANGWAGRFAMVWDCVQSWYTPNRPLARHKTCYLFGNEEAWDFDRAIIRDGKTRTEKDVWNTRGETHYVPLDGAVHMRTVEAFPNTAQNDENGYGKPVQWIGAMLSGYASGNVLDYFGGSGAVLVACEQLGMTCYTMEIDPASVDAIVDRWEKLTGKTAELQRDGGAE